MPRRFEIHPALLLGLQGDGQAADPPRTRDKRCARVAGCWDAIHLSHRGQVFVLQIFVPLAGPTFASFAGAIPWRKGCLIAASGGRLLDRSRNRRKGAEHGIGYQMGAGAVSRL